MLIKKVDVNLSLIGAVIMIFMVPFILISSIIINSSGSVVKYDHYFDHEGYRYFSSINQGSYYYGLFRMEGRNKESIEKISEHNIGFNTHYVIGDTIVHVPHRSTELYFTKLDGSNSEEIENIRTFNLELYNDNLIYLDSETDELFYLDFHSKEKTRILDKKSTGVRVDDEIINVRFSPEVWKKYRLEDLQLIEILE